MKRVILLLTLFNCRAARAGCAVDPNQRTSLLCEGAIDPRDLNATINGHITSLTLFDPAFVCSPPIDLHVLPKLYRVQSSSPNRCDCLCRSTPIEQGNCVVSFCPAPTTPQTTDQSPQTPQTTEQSSTTATRRTVTAKRRLKTLNSTAPTIKTPAATSSVATSTGDLHSMM
jgi:hypothetical protein